MTARQRLNLVLALGGSVILVVAVAIGNWLTAVAMVLLIIGQLGIFISSRRKPPNVGRRTGRDANAP